jgi:hypothetical protein
MNNLAKYSLTLSFEEVKFPPFEDIVIIGKKCPQGKIGLSKSFELLVPDEFKIFEVEDKIVEAVFINRRILKKINKERVISLLKEKVFPYVSESEILKVDLRVKVLFDSIEQEF